MAENVSKQAHSSYTQCEVGENIHGRFFASVPIEIMLLINVMRFISSPSLFLALLLSTLLLTGGCSYFPKKTNQAVQAPDLAETKSALFKPLTEENILLSDKTLTPLDAQQSPLEEPLPSPLLDKPLIPSPENLWQRISSGYTLLQQQDKTKFASTVKNYRKYRRYFSDISKNAAPYLHHIVESIEDRGMPLEIAMLPAVESAFRPYARSPYRAEGLWQFMPGTGRMFGLEQNRWYDGRRDVMAATDAALDYLQTLYQNLDNNWLHAIAAYNCGEGNVRRAIKKNLKQGKPIDYWSLDLPKETKAYIPKLMALSEIIAKPNDYGIALEDIPNQPYLHEINVGEQMDLKLAAKLAGIPLKELKHLNPAFKRNVMAPKGPFNLVLPIDKVQGFQTRLAKIDNKMPNGQPKFTADTSSSSNSSSSRRKYTIRSGDNLWLIARRHNTTVKKLCKLNRISSKKRLRIGTTLFIPASARTTKVASAKTKPAASSASTKTVLPVKHQSNRVHIIRTGEVLGSIAKQYKTTVELLCELNGITPKTVLRAGKTLLIPPEKPAQKI